MKKKYGIKSTNFQLKEEKKLTNSLAENIFQNNLESRKKYILNNDKNKDIQSINNTNDNSTKKQMNSTKTNNFRNSSIQQKNLLKYAVYTKNKNSNIINKKNKEYIYYKKYQSNNKFTNCKIDEKDRFTLRKNNDSKKFNEIEIKKTEYLSIRRKEKKIILEKKINDFFSIKRSENKKKTLKKETGYQINIKGNEKEWKEILKKDAVQQFLFERKKEKIAPKEKIKKLLEHEKITKEEIREILREFHIFINPIIKEKEEISQNNIDNNFFDLSNKNVLNKIDDNGIIPCNTKEKHQKEKEKEKIIKEKKRENLIEYQKIYGFKNGGNNCFLNSSLQLLTRIKELKEEVLNFKGISENNETGGRLINEFRKILVMIENSSNNNLIINPDKLKKIMGNVDNKYFLNGQEDSNEFIANFLNALLLETGNKEIPFKKLNIINELDKKPYENLCKKFFKKKGSSFIIDLFYGISKTIKNCKSCGKNNSIKFNAYNILEFQLYALAKKTKKEITLNSLYNNYSEEKKIEDDSCSFCNSDKIFTKTCIYTLPKYLIISFQRACDNEYCYNNVTYPKILKIRSEFDNIEHSYKLDCVIEHSGGAGYGHYTALIPIDKDNNIWWRFSDSYWNENNVGYQSDNAFLLLYKLN